MNFYQRVSVNSDRHLAKQLNATDLEISVIDSGNKESLERFQLTADEAFANEGDGYTIIRQHHSSMFSGELYDKLTLQLTD